ncbi:relaxase/mobilization nuclease domain-containing protein [uncultured Albimonas sp.]|uniref:relaxase/mobilization nuclease domain-containing protein n=1 Tax=uncultured Albimonas sp. TaxID=1331701 RepID=UPI0030EF6D66|tara:strand:+ start:781 stop:2058 length:1278 start_codon:yes stop_codon:yes gene_type:complete
MILVGSQRSGAAALATHLLNDRDNDHVEVVEISGFMADDLRGALREAEAISKATRCKQYLFSLSLNPPGDHVATPDEFREAANRAGKAIGLDGQPRAMVIHEKEGRRHAHVVWSRIDPETIKAVNLPHFKTRLRDVSRDLFLDHGWVLPKGLQAYGGKNPLNFSLAEWQQARRQSVDPREIKQVFRDAWERSNSLKGLSNLLEERGYFLARGDRRSVVALDLQGEVYALSRWSGVKTKDVRDKCGAAADELPSVADLRAVLKSKINDQLRGYIWQVKEKQARDLAPLLNERNTMVAVQRTQRAELRQKQTNRADAEAKVRMARLNGGLRGIFDRITGRHSRMKEQNRLDALACAERDQAERHAIVTAQLTQRRTLKLQADRLRARQAEDRKTLARSLRSALAAARNDRQPTPERPRSRTGPRLER